MKLPYAESSNYWQTSTSAPDKWIENAAAQVEKIGGQVILRGLGVHPNSGKSAFLLFFKIDDDIFRVVWPILPLKSANQKKIRAAQRQAATFLFHDVKARCLSAAILGARTSFFSFILLPDGRVASEVQKNEIIELGSDLFGHNMPMIEGEIVQGD